MYTKQQKLDIYWTAYCCLDGEECDLTEIGFMWLFSNMGVAMYEIPELWGMRQEWGCIRPGSPGWPERKEILIKAIEGTYKK